MKELLPDLKHLPGAQLAEIEAAIDRRAPDLHVGHGIPMQAVLEQLPDLTPDAIDLHTDAVTAHGSIDTSNRETLVRLLHEAQPWRKGPFELFGIRIDSEWRSNLKWDRLASHITPLENRRVLDIGCGNGYYLYRMASQNPALVLGIDPSIKFYYQFQIIQHYLKTPRTHLLPLGLDDFPLTDGYFDSVFCLGVLYHRRSPLDFLRGLRPYLAPGGELILETLTITGEGDMVLSPRDRYGKMNNCFFLPTPTCLEHWLERCGFKNVQTISTTRTTTSEQRRTEWVETESLNDFLDPADPTKTVEGYPAPERTIVLANR